jgi:hypothetical protein
VHWQLSQAQTPVSQQPQHAQLVPHEQPPLDLAVGSDANVARLIKASAATERIETMNLFMENPLSAKCEIGLISRAVKPRVNRTS